MLASAAALATGLAALLLKPVLEQSVRARIQAAAARHGMVARIGEVHAGIWPLLRLERFDLELGHGSRLHAERISLTWPGRLRVAIRAAALAGPAELSASAPATTWNVTGLFRGRELRLALAKPQGGLTLRRLSNTAGSTWSLESRALDIGRLLEVRRNGQPLLESGIADGRIELVANGDTLRFRVDLGVRGTRMGGLAGHAAATPRHGNPTDIGLRFEGAWQRSRGRLEVPGIHATVAGATVAGSLRLLDLGTAPSIDLAVGVQRLDFAQVLRASGLDVPSGLGLARGSTPDFGSATIDLKVQGRLAQPASLAVSQKIGFRPPAHMPPGIARLRGDFRFNADDGAGPPRPIDVSPASPDFIAMDDVPQLFLRTLLLAEDAGFYGHRGIDLRELPGAILTNWSRGTAARGASTITQQLAKNLFLSRDKQLGRKLQELAITFLLESALGKQRILEIYLNIIEWGPGLRGLRPAARVYFGREPQALTPAQMAFLVSIIPGPIKYQSSFARGSPGPGLRSLIDDLLGKLRSVDAISEEQYQRALRETIVVSG